MIKQKIKSIIDYLKIEKKIPIPVQMNSTELLKGKIAIVVGGSGGIGSAIAENFVLNGCKVILFGSNIERLNTARDRIIRSLRCEPSVIGILECNLYDITMYEGKIEEASEFFEERKIDILVNAAGKISTHQFLDTTVDEYDEVMNVNVKGVFFMCQAIAKYMIKNEIKGHILNVSSSSAVRPAWTPYQMSKWSVRGFTLGLADSLLPYGIIVNAIAPGPVATSMIGKSENDTIDLPGNPSKRYAVPSEIANLATFMVSDMGQLVVGDTFYITGGSGTINSHH